MSETKRCPSCFGRMTEESGEVCFECDEANDSVSEHVQATLESQRVELKAKVLAFAQNKMHAPWLKELAELFKEKP